MPAPLNEMSSMSVTTVCRQRYHVQRVRSGMTRAADARNRGGSTLNQIMNRTSFDAPGYRRIAVVGVSGSGKTTLARQLARRLGLRHVELDSLYWDRGWVPAQALVFRQRAIQAFECNAWVVDGNHPEVRDII